MSVKILETKSEILFPPVLEVEILGLTRFKVSIPILGANIEVFDVEWLLLRRRVCVIQGSANGRGFNRKRDVRITVNTDNVISFRSGLKLSFVILQTWMVVEPGLISFNSDLLTSSETYCPCGFILPCWEFCHIFINASKTIVVDQDGAYGADS
jgi:hypothetical protein